MKLLNSNENGTPVNRAIVKSNGLPFTWLHHQRIENTHFVHEVCLMPADDVYDTSVAYSCFKKSANGNILVLTTTVQPTLRQLGSYNMSSLLTDTSLVTESEAAALSARVPSVLNAVQRRFLFEANVDLNNTL